jgi:uncharacterized protein YbaR (Trm112 family)
MDPTMVSFCVCPTTQQPLREATEDELITLKLAAALVREDGLVAYPVHDEIPILLPEAAIKI